MTPGNGQPLLVPPPSLDKDSAIPLPQQDVSGASTFKASSLPIEQGEGLVILSPISAPLSPKDLARTGRLTRRLDIILTITVLLYAFLAASFPARNSDLWMHLAAGRLIAAGNYHFGVDP